MIEETGGSGVKAEFEGDSYKVTHKGEKFALYPGAGALNGGNRSVKEETQLSIANEERELAEALEKIRELE